jgi:hypothetical protein
MYGWFWILDGMWDSGSRRRGGTMLEGKESIAARTVRIQERTRRRVVEEMD